jgi:hypothetical protein
MNENWLRCTVFSGVFSDEVAVQVTPKEGDHVAFIVARNQVVGDHNQTGKVRVRVYRKGQTAWAILPTENQAVIPVNESDLVPA